MALSDYLSGFGGIGVTPLRLLLALTTVYVVKFVVKTFKCQRLWARQGIPQLNPWLVHIQFLEAIARKGPEGRDLTEIRQLGTIFGLNDVIRPALYISDANAIRDILIRDFHHFLFRREMVRAKYLSKSLVLLEGQEWKRVRTIMSPTFTSGKMKAMFPLMRQSLESLLKVLDKNSGKDLEVTHTFGCFTMDVIAKVAFAVETNTHEDPKHPFVENARQIFCFPKLRLLALLILPKPILNYFNIHFMDGPSYNYMIQLAHHMMDERRKTGAHLQSYHDFLELMLETGNESLTDEEIVANIILILFAGYHTSSTTLAFAAYELALNPDIQERAREEIRGALSGNNRKLDYETVNSLTYLDAVIHEVLRMYPPLIELERGCSEDYVLKANTPHLGRKDIFIPKGAGVIIPIYAIHFMEEYWPEPEKFDPTRFLPENKDQIVPGTFLTFVTGPRNCIGMRFALLELKMALSNILSQFVIKKSPKTKVPLDYKRSPAFLVPKEIVVQFDKI